ncbi:MAG: energy transducer TonB [Phaeodactylibacter sp.]|nr:energy transducer TonB [Phaeodactylibacter sp.]
MRTAVLSVGLFLFTLPSLVAQEGGATVDSDTTIYEAVEEMPRFPACEGLDTTLQAKNQCAQQALLSVMYKNIKYPLEARQDNIEGTVVVSFVVEKDSILSNLRIVKDIGGGCGLEVLRVVEGINEAGVKWVPGKNNGKVVRSRFNLPIKFKLEEVPPYTVIGRDTIYTEFEKPLEFKGGDEALQAYLTDNLDYPPSGNDSCLIGSIELQLMVRPNGDVRILDLIDYSGLDFDFWYEAISLATSTYGKWESATFEGRPVTAAYNITLPFIPAAPGCQQRVEQYDQANQLVREGAEQFDNGEKEAGIEKLSQAIALFPDNANFLIMRGQAFMDMNRFGEACEDLTRARRISYIDWYDGVLPVICKQE